MQADKEYRVAFITMQGVPKRFGKNRENLDIDAITAIKNRLASGPWSPEHSPQTVCIA